MERNCDSASPIDYVDCSLRQALIRQIAIASLVNDKILTKNQIAELFGITENRVSQIARDKRFRFASMTLAQAAIKKSL